MDFFQPSRITFWLVILLSSQPLFAQTNTFPTSGNVGIGTLNPTTKLQVNGRFYINTNDDSPLTFNNSDNSWQYIQFNRSGVRKMYIGLTSGDNFNFYKEGEGHIIFAGVGNVGIGTSSPNTKLHVSGVSQALTFRSSHSNTDYHQFTRNGTGSAVYINQVSNGSGFPILRLSSGTEVANSNVKFTVENDGKVGIGTTSPTNKLEVNGKIRSKEVIVEATGWPDYVFTDDYDLPTLAEIEVFIKANKHLPGVPSAKQVEENGLTLGEMNALLLKKIEELTLHTIEQEKTSAEQKGLIEQLMKRIEKLETKVDE